MIKDKEGPSYVVVSLSNESSVSSAMLIHFSLWIKIEIDMVFVLVDAYLCMLEIGPPRGVKRL